MVKDKLIDYYIEEYERQTLSRKRRGAVGGNLGEKASRLASTLHNAAASRMGFASLEAFHRQLGNIADAAYGKHNEKVLASVGNRMIPDLVRLDLGMTAPPHGLELTEVRYPPLAFTDPASLRWHTP